MPGVVANDQSLLECILFDWGEVGRNIRMHCMLKGMPGMHLYIYIARG